MREQEKANERREYSAFFSKFLGLSSRIQVKRSTVSTCCTLIDQSQSSVPMNYETEHA